MKSIEPDPLTVPLPGTLTASSTVLLVFLLALFNLTGSFEHWTFEDKRRDDAKHGRLVAPITPVRTAQGTRQTLWSIPADSAVNQRSVTLVNFIYTSCPSVCQALGAEYSQMQQALEATSANARNSIKLVSLSFDVEHDGPAQLAAYALRHRADANAWTIAAPLTRADTRTLLQALGIVVIPDGSGGYVHNGAIHLLDRSGTVLAIYDDADWQQALAMATHVSQTVR